jgi:hypothetical protein
MNISSDLNIECVYIPLNSEEILKNKPYEELAKNATTSIYGR